MFLIYSLLLTLAICALLPMFALDALRHGKYIAGLRERAGRVPPLDARGRAVIWLHCVSVGETQAARSLVRVLLERYPTYALVVSTTTLTGQRLAQEVFVKDAASIFYFPFDWAWSVRRALDAINPSLVLLMETELWPRFLRECAMRRIPVAIVNGRISDRSFSRYRMLLRFIRRVVSTLELAIMQTEADAGRMRALGLAADRVQVSGNIKFDAEVDTVAHPLTEQLRKRFALCESTHLIVAASTHAPEEATLIESFKQLKAQLSPDKQPRLLIAPRHPERFNEVASLLDASSFTWVRRTSPLREDDSTCEVILLDTIGELRAVYPLAEIVFVGGSISPTGGHNILEPAAAAKCIITGAHTFNFASIVRDFLERDALLQLSALEDSNASHELARALYTLLNDDERRRGMGRRARAALEESRGATERTVEMLAPILKEKAESGAEI